MVHRVLVVDDEPSIRFALRDFLETHGFKVSEAENCAEAERMFRLWAPDATVIDYSLPDGNALTLLGRLKSIDASVPNIVLTAHGTIELAVAAIKEGAEHFLAKPVELSSLLVILQRVFESQRARRKDRAAKSRQARRVVDPFIGRSAAIQSLRDHAARLVGSDRPVLITGETGTGKGVLASWLHANSPRRDEAMVDLNCAGLMRELLESELFGHEKGSFTGAMQSKPGLLETADKGTLFLDEIGDMDVAIQPRLLKVLEEKKFRRVGDVRDRWVDVRLIAATHQDLLERVSAGQFRQDLYYRVSTLLLHVPPLRERAEDIPALAEYFIQAFAQESAHDAKLSADAVRFLQSYHWPGNIRELRNVIERAMLLENGKVITSRELAIHLSIPTAHCQMKGRTLQEMEQHHIQTTLAEEQGNVVRAAKRLGISRSTLYEKISKLGL